MIVTNRVDMDERYLVVLPDDFDIERASEFGPLEYAQAHGEFLGVYAEDFRGVKVSRVFNSRAEALASLPGEVDLTRQGAAASKAEAPIGGLDPEQQAALEQRIAAYVFELTHGRVRSSISEDEAAQAAHDILQLMLAGMQSRTGERACKHQRKCKQVA